MCEQMLIDHCSPTLAGLKTASLVRVFYEDAQAMTRDLRELNVLLRSKGIRIVPLRFRNGSAQLYVYRPGRLCEDLRSEAVSKTLEDLGYDVCEPGRCVAQLAAKMNSGKGFPHEIGFFLGYPETDVIGFMKDGGAGSVCSGYWKVYSDVGGALKRFRMYDKCRDVYRSCFGRGRSIEQLTVSCP